MTVLSKSVESLLSSWKELHTITRSLASGTAAFPAEVEGLQGAAAGFFAASYVVSQHAALLSSLQYGSGKKSRASLKTVIVVPGEKDAAELMTDLQTAFPDSVDIFTLPWWGLIPYRAAAKGSAVFGKRSSVLARISLQRQTVTRQSRPEIFIVSLRSLVTPVPSPEYIRSLVFTLQKGMQLEPSELSDRLSRIGYMRVPKVTVPGEYTVRGEVMDIYTPGTDCATRIVFDFDSIEQIKLFSPETQATTGTADSLLVYPMKEVVWTDELIDTLEARFEAMDSALEPGQLPLTDKGRLAKDSLLNELRLNRECEGEELYYPALWGAQYSLLDYLDEKSSVLFFDYDRLENAQESFQREFAGMYRQARQELPVLPPSAMLYSFEAISQKHERRILYRTLHTDEADSAHSRFVITCDPPRSFFGNINYLKEQIEALQSDGWRIIIFADNPNQSVRIRELLKEYTEQSGEAVQRNASRGKVYYPVTVLPEAISAGFGIPENKIILIQENEIFGRRKHTPKSLQKGVKSAAIDTFIDLSEGDFVVHVNYGIGVFKGIQRVTAMGNERDYIKLEYAGEEVAFVPIEQVNLVQRYIGNEGEKPALDRIGSKNWENRKNRVKKAVEDLAQKLIDLYSRRKASRGFPFPKDTEWQTAFEAAFPYEDTPDQYTVTKEIKDDMEKPVPMDRLVCGDVGYGKTEIAMRAAFKAVMGGKQVAFLAPTTILAEQHYENCVERFANFPVKIAQMSRFVSPSEQKKVLKRLQDGDVDILVGTHRIIQKDVVFRDLGLMIIDEEQRFGVKDKERLKTMKANIDSLAMSATPIPRTLHMSLLKIRDMSLLTTPPQSRQPIETVIDEYTDERVAEAIRREVDRGGQVFYLHNRVESLDDVRRNLEHLLPEMMVDVAHGQMTSEELDDIFRRFKMGGFHILVATTIIENGIDIPNVNTIIIDRADMYGVSQLYQLRGRVGRSDRKAYAYLLYPKNKVLSEVAMKRLQVISDFTELGSGFKIAMKDMEIRGAGNLLGRDQSGDVYSVGFDMYMRLLNEAVERLTQQEHYEEQNEVLMELEYTGFIPDSYVPGAQTKMEVYKKVASVQTKAELESLYLELDDRFGPVPDEVLSLLSLAEVRIIAKRLRINTLKERQGVIRIEFGKVSSISVDKVLRLVRESNGKVRPDPTQPNILLITVGKIGLKEKSEFIREQLEKLE
ncbi:MAG: transcription-repair coupling factor [Treponema sp.]|nr:transcription-repair coupling factor [Treponema sp.]